jgi:hypothetical protein
MKAKKAPEYSVLKPETNSDSASAKSKGARCLSARLQINQMRKKTKNRGLDNTIKLFTEKDLTRKQTSTTKVLNTDS